MIDVNYETIDFFITLSVAIVVGAILTNILFKASLGVAKKNYYSRRQEISDRRAIHARKRAEFELLLSYMEKEYGRIPE